MRDDIFMNKLLKNFSYNLIYQIVVLVIPLITMPYLARVLEKEAIGIYSYTNSVVLLFSTIGLLGLGNYSKREIAYSKSKGEKQMSESFLALCVIRLILYFVSMVIYVLMLSMSEYKIFFLLQIINLSSYFFDISWFFIGIEELKIVVIQNTIVRIVSTCLIFLLVKNPADLGMYILINGGSLLLGAVIMMPQAKKYITLTHINQDSVNKHWIPIIKLFLPQAASSIYVLFDKTMIKWLTGDIESVGFYDQSQNIAKMPVIIATSLSTVMMPRISYEYTRKQFKKVKEYLTYSIELLIVFIYPIIFGIIVIAPGFIEWFLGSDFMPCVKILQLLSILILPISFTNVTGVQYLIAFDKTKELTFSYICAAIINLVLNTLLIPCIGVYGAAIGTITAELVVLFIQYGYMKDEFGSMQLIKKSRKSIIASFIMMIIVMYFFNGVKVGVLSTMLQVLFGAIIYFILLVLFREKIISKYLLNLRLKK